MLILIIFGITTWKIRRDRNKAPHNSSRAKKSKVTPIKHYDSEIFQQTLETITSQNISSTSVTARKENKSSKIETKNLRYNRSEVVN